MKNKAAIWTRVSTSDQDTENQMAVLREWAQDRGLVVVAEYAVVASAWSSNESGRPTKFETDRKAMLDGARKGKYNVLLIWAGDRLSRRGPEDMLRFVRELSDTGCELWSHQDPWMQGLGDPMIREMLLGIFATIAKFESNRRSERIRAGIAAKVTAGKLTPGRKPGAKDTKPRKRSGYYAQRERERETA